MKHPLICLATFAAGVVSLIAPAQQAPAQMLLPVPPIVEPDTPVGSGPYLAVMMAAPGLPTHTVYQPAKLPTSGLLPVVVWGNGGCFNVGSMFRWFLSDVASYGYFVIAVGEIGNPLPSFPPESMAPVPPMPANVTALGTMKLPPPATRSSQLLDGMNWAIAENERKDSPYYHHLDTQAIAIMGQSCGGIQAIEASADPRVRTSMIWSSGLFKQPITMAGGKAMTRADLKLLHAPTAYISGDDEDIAFMNANDDFEHIEKIPLFRAYGRGITHGGTFMSRNGGEFAGIAVAWLNWQLKKDKHAAKLFIGPNCGLCVNPHWVVRSKNLH